MAAGVGPVVYEFMVARDAEVMVRYDRAPGGVVGTYSVVLRVMQGRWRTVRSYDNVHGPHEMHRYNRDGTKHAGEECFSGAAEAAMNAALDALVANFEGIIQSWQKR